MAGSEEPKGIPLEDLFRIFRGEIDTGNMRELKRVRLHVELEGGGEQVLTVVVEGKAVEVNASATEGAGPLSEQGCRDVVTALNALAFNFELAGE